MGGHASVPQQKYDTRITKATTAAVIDTINTANSVFVANQTFKNFCGGAESNKLGASLIQDMVLPEMSIIFQGTENVSATDYLAATGKLIKGSAPCYMSNINLTQLFLMSDEAKTVIANLSKAGTAEGTTNTDVKRLNANIERNLAQATGGAGGPSNARSYAKSLSTVAREQMSAISQLLQQTSAAGQELIVGDGVTKVNAVSIYQVFCATNDLLQGSQAFQKIVTDVDTAITDGQFTSKYQTQLNKVLNVSQLLLLVETVGLVCVLLLRKLKSRK